MKESNKIKANRFILATILLFLITAAFPASNRSTCPAFGTKSMDTISQTILHPKRRSKEKKEKKGTGQGVFVLNNP